LGGISRNTLYQMLRKGELASVILGCRRFIAADAMAKLIRASTPTNSLAMDSTRSRQAAQEFFSLPLPKTRRRTGGNQLSDSSHERSTCIWIEY
jgi:hypothetical protein